MAHAPEGAMSIKSFRDLVAWQRGMTLAEQIYSLTRKFPPSERYGMSFQLRKATTSIPSNIAEGHQKPTRSYLYHLNIALGECNEAQTQLELSYRVGLAPESTVKPILADADEVGRLVRGLLNSVERRSQSDSDEGPERPDRP